MAISTAFAIYSAVSAGLSIYGAHKASKAAKDAAKTQVESADKALALQARMYDESRALMKPYADLGGQAFQTLGSLMGLGGPAPGGASPPAQGTPSTAPYTGRVPSPQEAAWFAERVGPDGTMRTKEPTAPKTKQDLMNSGEWAPNSSIGDLASGGAGLSTSGYAAMQAPDGSIERVPRDMVPFFEQQGAKQMTGRT